jgi:hypothetical protein
MRSYYDPEAGTEIEESDFLDEIEASEATRNEYREASQKMLSVILGAITFIRDSRTATELRFRIDLLGYIFGLPELANLSEDAVGLRHNKTRAAVSHEILKFQRRNGLQELFAQKKSSSRKAYHKTRKAQLTNHE